MDDRTHNASIKSKGMEAYISEATAQEMFNQPGHRYLLLIEVHTSEQKVNTESGSKRAMLTIDTAEVIPQSHEDRFRDVMRTLWENRPTDEGQAVLPLSKDAVANQDATLGAAVAEVEEWDGNTEKADGKVVEFSGTAKKTTAAKKTAARK